MSLSGTQLPKPKNWQDFERSTRELFACVLGDPETKMHGRTGQPQNGVDVYGRRGATGGKWVGVQCKLSEDEITEAELKAELAKAMKFTPPITEFHLATTAPRDAKIDGVARQLTTSLAGTSRPVLVKVWGWQDIEEEAAKHAAAHKTFDPTWNPYAEEARIEVRAGFQSLHDRLGGISQSSGVRLNPQDVELLGASARSVPDYTFSQNGTETFPT